MPKFSQKSIQRNIFIHSTRCYFSFACYLAWFPFQWQSVWLFNMLSKLCNNSWLKIMICINNSKKNWMLLASMTSSSIPEVVFIKLKWGIFWEKHEKSTRTKLRKIFVKVCAIGIKCDYLHYRIYRRRLLL